MDTNKCGNCNTFSPALYSHPDVTGDQMFDETCFRMMGRTLRRLKKYCPICYLGAGHRGDCILGLMERGNQ